MKKYLIMGGIVLLVLAIIFAFAYGKFSVSGKAIAPIHNNYTWTKAICNSRGCIDITIECEDGKVKSMKPASNFVRMENFTDPRENSDVLCE